jgi:hypothetical protein
MLHEIHILGCSRVTFMQANYVHGRGIDRVSGGQLHLPSVARYAGSFGGTYSTPAEAGVYFLEPPTAADLARVAGLQEIATGFSRWNGSAFIEPA